MYCESRNGATQQTLFSGPRAPGLPDQIRGCQDWVLTIAPGPFFWPGVSRSPTIHTGAARPDDGEYATKENGDGDAHCEPTDEETHYRLMTVSTAAELIRGTERPIER
jgi:hypothetical protein